MGHAPIRLTGDRAHGRGKWGLVMTLRAMLLSIATIFGISLWGIAVYSDGAVAGNAPVDGYGVSAVTPNAN